MRTKADSRGNSAGVIGATEEEKDLRVPPMRDNVRHLASNAEIVCLAIVFADESERAEAIGIAKIDIMIITVRRSLRNRSRRSE
jgi:hypothetical protein